MSRFLFVFDVFINAIEDHIRKVLSRDENNIDLNGIRGEASARTVIFRDLFAIAI